MYLGIDIGTSALKILMTADGLEAVATVSRPLATETPREGWSEQDPQAWWDALVEGCAALKAAHPAEWAAVRGLGLSGQMHGAVCLDAGLRPLRRSWSTCCASSARASASTSFGGSSTCA